MCSALGGSVHLDFRQIHMRIHIYIYDYLYPCQNLYQNRNVYRNLYLCLMMTTTTMMMILLLLLDRNLLLPGETGTYSYPVRQDLGQELTPTLWNRKLLLPCETGTYPLRQELTPTPWNRNLLLPGETGTYQSNDTTWLPLASSKSSWCMHKVVDEYNNNMLQCFVTRWNKWWPKCCNL
jgi:hypothetical protein